MKKLIFTISFLLLFTTVALSADTTHRAGTNYSTSSGEKWVVGGEIQVEQNGLFTGMALKVASIAMTGVDYTLSTAEALCNLLVVTGSPSGKSIIAPTLTTSGAALLYTVRNAGSDSASVNIKATGKTGIDIATGKTAEVYFLTDDYVRKTADATH